MCTFERNENVCQHGRELSATWIENGDIVTDRGTELSKQVRTPKFYIEY